MVSSPRAPPPIRSSDGILWAMGENLHGQLGNGTNNGTPNPIPVTVASNVVSVAAGGSHSLFVTSDGTLWAMGYGANGQLGNGLNGDSYRPLSVTSNVVAVAAGYLHSLFIKADGTLWGMGLNFYGQLGNGTTVSTNWPVFVASNVVEVAAAYTHSLFVKSNGTLWVMGGNSYGQLGNGTTDGSSVPVQVTNLICASLGPSTEAYHSLAVAALLPQLSGPTNQNVALSNAISFAATSAGGDGPFTYQWQFNGTNIGNATNSSYAIAAASLSDGGTYMSIVSGMGGSSSKSATLTVFQPPQNFQVQSTSNHWLKLMLVGTANYPYILQSTTNLTPPINWKPVLTNPADINGNWQFTVTNLNNNRQFYRALAK